MTNEMRENIKNSIRCVFKNYADDMKDNPNEAYLRCYAFGYGVQIGSQDAELVNFVNRLLADYRIELIDRQFEEKFKIGC